MNSSEEMNFSDLFTLLNADFLERFNKLREMGYWRVTYAPNVGGHLWSKQNSDISFPNSKEEIESYTLQYLLTHSDDLDGYGSMSEFIEGRGLVVKRDRIDLFGLLKSIQQESLEHDIVKNSFL
jgi:hypothetical protein